MTAGTSDESRLEPVVPACAGGAAGDGCLGSALSASGGACPGHRRRRMLEERQTLFRAGEALSAIYVVRGGSFKSQIVSEDGREQISGVHLRGSVVGIEGIASGKHIHTLVALERSEVCVLPTALIERLAVEVPGVQRWFHRLLSRAIVAVTEDMTLLGHRKAEERLTAFLLNLSVRFSALGHSPRNFDLRLTRREIGSHLGLSAATVSRTFAELNRKGVIKIGKHAVEFLELQAPKEPEPEMDRARPATATNCASPPRSTT